MSSKNNKKISYVIPCYRSENTITQVVSQIESFMAEISGYDYEVILVNDHSPDDVWRVISDISKQNSKVYGISLARNFGQHAALLAGYNTCTGDYVVTIDDDGQTPVDQTMILLEKLVSGGFDVVYGEYRERKDANFRKFGTVLNNLMLEKLLNKPKGIRMTSYFVAKRYVIKELCEYKNCFPYIWGLILRVTRNIGNATIDHSDRIEGESGYTISKLLSLWMNGFTAFSVKPLRLTTVVGFVFSIIGFFALIFTVVDRLFFRPQMQAGYTALMSVLLIIGGLVLLSLGLIGEYVGRMYMCINNTPQFVISETTDETRESI